MSGNRSRINPKQVVSLMIFVVYCVVALLAGYHTYEVFALADPPFFAFLGAVAVDGMLALTLYLIGSWGGDQRIVGLVGVFLFAILSGTMQIIARRLSMGEALPIWLQFAADYAVPISVTLSLLVLGAIKYFDGDGNGIPDFMERGNKNKGGNNWQVQPQSQAPRPQPQVLPEPGMRPHGPPMGQNGNGRQPARAFEEKLDQFPRLVEADNGDSGKHPTPPRA